MSNSGNITDQIYKQALLVRDLVIEPRIGFKLRQDKSKWGKVIASLDVIEDTCMAINSLPAQSAKRIEKGLLYLAVYGLLQSLFVQQNAVASLCKTLDFHFDESDETLKTVRGVRNDCVGHPTDRRDGSVHSISQVTLSLVGFQMMLETQQGEMIFKDIELTELIEQQGAVIEEVMTDLVMEIKRRDKQVREKYKSKKLRTAFPENTGYYLGKILESTSEHGRLEIGLASLMTIKNALSSFIASLEERGLGISTYVGIEGGFKEIEVPEARLEQFFKEGVLPGESCSESRKTACIFADYYRKQVLQLMTMAESIDMEYEQD